ncbi:uncharacterized protein [Spinacia oleracea]|uniref:Retrotransposon Copia-like N-terminal domain-containing protein n=1 Tax=Spinacia oleracea TaxID=3562 RepID=A0ABM3R0U8_SPIOL|nr:uncharacterized protein LOC110805263 [Spinacia oleracea]XP_056689253.1 uncharacterized protein LOC110805263 [Spinacia oleracea]XP_056689254.1 uncharacterized protein LOC110805263 [Spinacia oleracea]XP_056689255.1 uncharacterized protein LOC110805263 [Spinacia oleracea]XP_056689256.1 uncharacterized protein LOC110805263 [Spinacia oleracea]
MADTSHATLSNIKNAVPIVLELDKGQYSHWAELFKLHCRVHRVIDHIIAPAPSAAGDSTTVKTEAEIAEWNRLDAAVLQWIYGTISHDLLSTIIVPDTTAMKAWESLRLIFQDNEISRAVCLEQQFNAVKLDNFPNMDSYCLELKTLADQLAGVGAPVSNNRLVLRLIAGLNANYDGMAINLSRAKPLPSFTEARSSLCMEEKRKAHQAGDGAAVDATALLTTNHHDDSDGAPNNFNRSNQPRRGGNNGNRGHNGGKRGGRGKHRGVVTTAATPPGLRPTMVNSRRSNLGVPGSGFPMCLNSSRIGKSPLALTPCSQHVAWLRGSLAFLVPVPNKLIRLVHPFMLLLILRRQCTQ